MYTWLLAAGLGATLLLPQVLRGRGAYNERNGRRWWVAWAGYVLLIAACIYLHHFGFLIPAAHGVFVLIWLAATRDARGFLRWLTAGLAVLLIYLPWLPRLLGIFGFPGWRAPLDPWAVPSRYWTAYTVGDSMPAPWRTWLPLAYLILAVLGVFIWPRVKRLGAVLLLVCAVVPIAGALLLALRQPDYHERYTLFASAPIVLLAAAGLFSGSGGEVRRRTRKMLDALGVLGLACLLAANAMALHRLYTDTTLHKPDYRAAAQRIAQHEATGDVILVDGPDPEKVFRRYYSGDAPVVDLRSLEGATDAEVDAALREITGGAARAWGLLYFHRPGPVQAWLARHGWPAAESIHNGIFVTLNGLEVEAGAPVSKTTEAIQLGSGLVLDETEVVCDDGALQADRLDCPAGALVRVTNHWTVSEPLPGYRFSLRLADAMDRVWAAEDYTPEDGFAPTDGWPIGAAVTERRGLLLPADLPPGDYRLTLRLYDPATGAVVETATETDVTLAELGVTAAMTPSLGVAAAQGIPQPHVAVMGGGLALLGMGIAPEPLQPGRPGELSVWWQVGDAPVTARQVLVEAIGPGNNVTRQIFPLVMPDAEGVQDWQPGQVVRERYPLALDPAAPGGSYRLKLTALDATGAPLGAPQAAGRVRVEERPRRYRLPAVQHPLDVTLGDHIALRGYELALPDDAAQPIGLTLYWQAKDRVTERYKVFVHLVGADGQIAAQSDAYPAGGEAPTESWLAREVIIDPHTLTAPESGTYRLFVGLYDPETGVRPAVVDADGNPLPDRAVPLGEVVLR